MKTIATILCSAVLFVWLTPAVVQAQFTYSVNSETGATVTGYTGTNSVVAIPNTDHSYLVTGIGQTAFSFNTIITSVTMPNGVASIGSEAFTECSSLTNVTFGSGIASIGYGAFDYCTSLGSIIIPDSVTNLSNDAFFADDSLTSVTLGNQVASIGDGTFEYCTSLTNIALGSAITSIGEGAFEYCSSLGGLIIPAGVTNIGASAFAYCTNLSAVLFLGNAPSADATVFAGSSNAVVYTLNGTTGWGLTLGGAPVDPASPVVYKSQTALLSSNVTFIASNSLPMTYQWYFSNPALQTPAGGVAQLYNGFVYGVVVTNGGSGYTTVPNVQFVGGGGYGAGGAATLSNGMVVSINMTNANSGYTNAPAVVIDPPSGLLIGKTSKALTLTAITTNNLGNYYVVGTAGYGSFTSSVATLTLAYAPTITQQPSNQIVLSGSGVDFSVTAAGTSPLSYQWWMAGGQQINAAAVPVVTNGFIVGATVTNGGAGYLTVPSVQITGGGGSGAGGVAVVSNQMVTAVTITNAGFGYTSRPAIQIGAPGTLLLNGQTSSYFSLLSVTNSNVGDYFVVVTNFYGSVTSSVASLNLEPVGYDLITNPALIGGQMQMSFAGLPDAKYILDRSFSLAPANWIPQATNSANASGWLLFTNVPNPATNNFWRIRSYP